MKRRMEPNGDTPMADPARTGYGRCPMKTHTATHESQLTDCIAICAECHETCERMIFDHCLKLGGKHVQPDHLKLMADCVQICRTAADFMIRNSPHHGLVCRACAEICEACARDCESVGDMEECVSVCRRCAASCEQMSA